MSKLGVGRKSEGDAYRLSTISWAGKRFDIGLRADTIKTQDPASRTSGTQKFDGQAFRWVNARRQQAGSRQQATIYGKGK
jgi:hypothetical protein